MTADERLQRIAAAYPARVPRAGVDGVRALMARAGIAPPSTVVAVVGTNGKTSTALHLARLLGPGCGVTVSPHLVDWGERVRVDGAAVPDDRLAVVVEELHDLAPADAELRFFDLLTLAAARLFAEVGVQTGIFEAGIGGRVDAVRALDAQLVLLTSVGLDHTELLGSTEAEIRREKLAVAAPGTPVLTATADGPWPRRNAALAEAAARALGREPAQLELEVEGRLERLRAGGVDVILDAAHNEQAWTELGPLLPEAFVAVVARPAGRPTGALDRLLENARAVVETGVGGEAVEAVRAGLEHARRLELPLVVTGSTYLLGAAYFAASKRRPTSSQLTTSHHAPR